MSSPRTHAPRTQLGELLRQVANEMDGDHRTPELIQAVADFLDSDSYLITSTRNELGRLTNTAPDAHWERIVEQRVDAVKAIINRPGYTPPPTTDADL